MASRFVVCKDKAEARKYYDAGLLYLNMGIYPDIKWEPAEGVNPVERYGYWPWENKNDYAYLVEEDEECQWDTRELGCDERFVKITGESKTS